MIPKVIHYCWFGGNPLPELAQKCIESWKKFCPDYEIKQWDETNFDVNCCDYVREAYEAKKWAFVSDYARYKILYDHGGLYFDTDVELIKPIDDIVANGSFLGCEINPFKADSIASGLGMGAEAGLPIYQDILEHYEQSHFLQPDGTFDITTVVDRTTAIFEKHGFAPADIPQKVADVTIYPPRYFCPLDMETGEVCVADDTCSIHYYDGSWLSETQKKAISLRKKYIGKYGNVFGKVFYKLPYSIYIIRRCGCKALLKKTRDFFRKRKCQR